VDYHPDRKLLYCSGLLGWGPLVTRGLSVVLADVSPTLDSSGLLSFYFNSSSIKMAPPSKNPFSMSKTGKSTNPPPKRPLKPGEDAFDRDYGAMFAAGALTHRFYITRHDAGLTYKHELVPFLDDPHRVLRPHKVSGELDTDRKWVEGSAAFREKCVEAVEAIGEVESILDKDHMDRLTSTRELLTSVYPELTAKLVRVETKVTDTIQRLYQEKSQLEANMQAERADWMTERSQHENAIGIEKKEISRLERTLTKTQEGWSADKSELEKLLKSERDTWTIEKSQLEKTLRTERDTWTVEKSQLEETLRRDGEAWTAEKSKLEGTMKSERYASRKENTRLHMTITDVKSRWKTEKSQLEESQKSENLAWETKNKQLDEKIRALSTENQSLAKQKSTLENKLQDRREAWDEEKSKLQEDIQDLKEAWAQSKSELREEIKDLNEEKEAWEDDKHELEEKIRKLNDSWGTGKSKLEATIQQFNIEKAAWNEDKSRLDSTIALLTSNNSALVDEGKTLLRENGQLQQSVQDLTVEKNVLAGEKTQLEQSLTDQVDRKLDGLRELNKKQTDMVRDLRVELNGTKEKFVQLTIAHTICAEVKAELDQFKDVHSDCADIRTELEQLKDAHSACAEVKTELDQLKVTHYACANVTQEDFDKLSNSLGEVQAKFETLQASNTSSTRSLERVRAELNFLRFEHSHCRVAPYVSRYESNRPSGVMNPVGSAFELGVEQRAQSSQQSGTSTSLGRNIGESYPTPATPSAPPGRGRGQPIQANQMPETPTPVGRGQQVSHPSQQPTAPPVLGRGQQPGQSFRQSGTTTASVGLGPDQQPSRYSQHTGAPTASVGLGPDQQPSRYSQHTGTPIAPFGHGRGQLLAQSFHSPGTLTPFGRGRGQPSAQYFQSPGTSTSLGLGRGQTPAQSFQSPREFGPGSSGRPTIKFLASGFIADGRRITDVDASMFPKVEAQIVGWEASGFFKRGWAYVSPAGGERCCETRRRNLNRKKCPVPSDPHGNVACKNCIEKGLLCMLIDDKGPVVVPLPPWLRDSSVSEREKTYYYIEGGRLLYQRNLDYRLALQFT
jgi:predicted  nucleic acid-binding Zn-ribbon protein